MKISWYLRLKYYIELVEPATGVVFKNREKNPAEITVGESFAAYSLVSYFWVFCSQIILK